MKYGSVRLLPFPDRIGGRDGPGSGVIWSYFSGRRYPGNRDVKAPLRPSHPSVSSYSLQTPYGPWGRGLPSPVTALTSVYDETVTETCGVEGGCSSVRDDAMVSVGFNTVLCNVSHLSPSQQRNRKGEWCGGETRREWEYFYKRYFPFYCVKTCATTFDPVCVFTRTGVLECKSRPHSIPSGVCVLLLHIIIYY